MDERFKRSFQQLMKHEGGYVNDPDDAGGETNYGISKRSYPDLDIKNLTIDEAEVIYYHDYWLHYKMPLIEPYNVAEKVFITLVHMHPRLAGLCVQQALDAHHFNLKKDGVIGPNTRQAINFTGEVLIYALRSEIAGEYRRQVLKEPKKQKYLKGWLHRAYM